jgi:hypothetical protein
MNIRPGMVGLAGLILAGSVAVKGQSPAETGTRGGRDLREVVIVFKTHFDIGYTDMASNIVAKYRTTMIDQALEVVDASRELPSARQFTWTIPGWPMHKITEPWPGQTPERQRRVMRAFREGRFAVHALPFTLHTELLEPEDLVRGLRFSSALARASGQPLPRDAKMTDVPSHSWVWPTLLRHAGVEFLHLGCNPASRSPRVPTLFWWEGPDGSRVLTMYSAQEYGTGLKPPPDWPHGTWLALIHTGDNHGPPRPEEVQRLLEQAGRELPDVKVRIGRLADFADAILAEQPQLPVVRGDMPDTWIHGPLADPRGARLARTGRPALATTETLGTHLTAWGVPMSDQKSTLADAYEQSLLYGEHTWGGAFWWISGKYELNFGAAWWAEREAGKFERIESSWDEHTAYIERMHQLVAPALAGQMERLVRAVNVPGRRIVVFNPLPWKRDGLVTLSVPGGAGALADVTTGEAVALECGEGGSVRFVARDVPAGGYRTYALAATVEAGTVSKPPTASGNTLENRFFKLTLDPRRGVVSSWLDKRTGRELVDARAPHGLGQYLYERFSRNEVQRFVDAYVKISADWATNELGKPSLPSAAEVPYRAGSPRDFTLHLETGEVSSAAVFSRPADTGGGQPITTKFVIYRDLPLVDLEVTVHDKPYDPWPEAGWIGLPFGVENPRFRLARLGAVVDPSRDFVNGCNFDQIALNGGLTVAAEDGMGVGLCALDSPVVSLGKPGGWQYTGTWSPRKAHVYLNVFNNQWTTNFRLWNAGTWSSRVRLWATEARDDATDLMVAAEEARFPLVAAFGEGAAGTWPAGETGLEVSQRGVKVTAFGPNPDGEGTVLRLWELAGGSGLMTVVLPRGFRAATAVPVDLRGRPVGAAIRIGDRRFRAETRAFAPASFVLR